MKHPNVLLLEKLYGHFKEGNFEAALDLCADTITFQVPGKSALAGKYTKENFFSGFIQKIGTLSEGTSNMQVHDILGSDLHAAVLGSDKITRNGKTTEYRTVHIWRFEHGKPVAWYEYPRDLYQFDQIWSN